MFVRLFAERGLSLDRLRSLLEVGAAGSIAKAASGDPVRQSQYSRQIKELEDFFQTRLVERHGKGVRLTQNGKALARISRFFMLGLSNFQRGCLAEEQVFRIGASATFIESFLLPILAVQQNARYAVETLANDEIERRLHDLTLDFGVVTAATLSRPLQFTELGSWGLSLWAPKSLHKNERQVLLALKEKRLRLVLAAQEMEAGTLSFPTQYRPALACNSFIEAKAALNRETLAAFLPDFLTPHNHAKAFLRMEMPAKDSSGMRIRYQLGWNPRLLRLNPHAVRGRDFLLAALKARVHKA